MNQDIKVPEVGESITEGMLTAWLKEEGGLVAQDDPLFELETDKITMEVPSPHAGRLHILVPAGETVLVGQVVGTVDTAATTAAPGEDVAAPAPSAPAPSQAAAPTAPASPAPTPSAPAAPTEALPPTLRGVPGFGPTATAAAAQVAPAAPAPAAPAPALEPTSGREVMRERLRRQSQDTGDLSPAVRRLVLENRISPEEIPGSGPGGRITKGDVLSYLEGGGGAEAGPAAGAPGLGEASATPTASAPSTAAPSESEAAPTLAARPAPAPSAGGGARQSRAKMSPLRQRIAERLVAAQQTAAMLTTFNEVDMSAVMALRDRHKAEFEKKHGVRLGFMSFFVKAAVDALQTLPQVNAFIDGDEIVTNHFYDIGVAVGTDRGLVVPVIRDADRLSYAGIEAGIGELARKVRDKKISLDDLQGGCFTITNGGIYGSLLSTPILNPPQSAILGMHAIKKRPVVVDDEIVIRPMMYLALSYDHRLVDGKDAVTFLRRIVECLESPERMLLDV